MFIMHKSFNIVYLMLVIIFAWINFVHAVEYTCARVSSKLNSGLCLSTKVTMHACVDKTHKGDVVNTLEKSLTGSGDVWTDTTCQAFYTALDLNIGPGCHFMDSASTFTTSPQCDKEEYCNEYVSSQYNVHSDCSTSAECPSKANNEDDKILCCSFIEKHLRSQCSSVKDNKLIEYLDKMIDDGVCRRTDCVGTGNSLKVAKLTIFLLTCVSVIGQLL